MTKRQMLKAVLTMLVLLVAGVMLMPAYATDTPGVVMLGGTPYATLEEAIAAANTGDTLTLSGGDLAIASTVVIPATKQLTLDLGGNALISRVDVAYSRMLSVQNAGAFTLRNGRLTAEDVNGDGLTGGAFSAANSTITIDQIQADGFKASGDGGVVYIGGSNNQVNISNSSFHDNSAGSRGGAIAISNYTSVVRLEANKIYNNRVVGDLTRTGAPFTSTAMVLLS